MTKKSPRFGWVLTPYSAFGFVIIFCLIVSDSLIAQPPQQNDQPDGLTELKNKAAADGTIRVIVQLNVPFEAEGTLSGAGAKRTQRGRIASAQARVAEQMSTAMETVTEFAHIPFMAVRVDSAAIEQLATLPEVKSIQEDEPIPIALDSTTPIIGADTAWANGYTGAGQAVAILDTGVDLDHPAFNGRGSRIVAEGCFSTTDAGYGSVSVCPGGVASSTAPGSGADCVAASNGFPGAQSNCTHGTHVAGIAAGDDGTVRGVAPEADIIAIQIFSLFTSSAYCGGGDGCALTFTSDQILGLEYVYDLHNSHDIASVNMSLGSSTPFSAACDSDGRKAAIDNLRSVGIATVIASGNNGYKNGISKPACISSAVSVGATDDADTIASFSNVAPILDVLAPGTSILAAVPNGYGVKSGTSMATPHVAGAWALYKQAVPNASVDDVLAALQSSGTPIDDSRSGGVEQNIPRINVDQAISQYVPGLTVEITASQLYALPGSSLSYTVTVRNETAVTASNVSLNATIPNGFVLNPSSLSSDATITGVVANAQLHWDTTQTLLPSQSLTRTFGGSVDPVAARGTAINTTLFAASPDMQEARQATAVTYVTAVASCDFSDGFETGVLGPSWAVETVEDGRVSIINQLPKSGNYALLLDDSISGGAFSEASAVLTVDLSNQVSAMLEFDWYDLADEYDTHFDGVFFREHPTSNWIKAYNFSGNTVDRYQSASIDLKQFATDNGLQFTNQFQIKFVFYDNYPANFDNLNGGDGYLIDNVALYCEPAGLTLTTTMNETSLDPGQRVTVTMVVENNSTTIATNAVIDSDIPSGFTFAGPVLLHGNSGNVAKDAGDLPTLLSNSRVEPGGQITLILPLMVDVGQRGGTMLTLRSTLSSDLSAEPVVSELLGVVMNVAPLAVADTVNTSHHTPLTIFPLDNDSDRNGDPLTITDMSQPSKGGSVVVSGNAVEYTPRRMFAGVEQISYTVSDGTGGTAVGTISITVPNVAPVAHDDATATQPGTAVYYPVLVNDSDTNDDALTVLSIGQPANGAASIQDNLIVYTSTSDFLGQVTIDYTIGDGRNGNSSARLIIDVATNANGAPVAQSDAPATERDASLQIRVLDNDMDPNRDAITLVAVSTPIFGSASIDGDIIRYTPSRGFIGVDTFEYTIRDAKGLTASTAVTVAVALENTEVFAVDPNATAVQTIRSADNQIILSIPVGALSSTTRQIAYTRLDGTLARPATQGVGVNFALNVGDGSQIFTGSPSFDPPLDLTLRYDPATLPFGVSEANLQLLFFDEGAQTWQAIDITQRDLINNTITARLDHFTDFTMAGTYELYLPTVVND